VETAPDSHRWTPPYSASQTLVWQIPREVKPAALRTCDAGRSPVTCEGLMGYSASTKKLKEVDPGCHASLCPRLNRQ
jgi:hypothetical protein